MVGSKNNLFVYFCKGVMVKVNYPDIPLNLYDYSPNVVKGPNTFILINPRNFSLGLVRAAENDEDKQASNTSM